MTDPRLAPIEARLAAGDATGAIALADALVAAPATPALVRLNALLLRSRAHEAARDLPRAIDDLDAALLLDPSQAKLWNELGFLCTDAGRGKDAIAAFERATRADPRYARAWNNLANALRGAGRGADALAAAQRAIEIDPAYALAWANLGALRRENADEQGAEAALRRAIALDPRQRGAWLALGALLRERSDLVPAAEAFATAARLDPRDGNACMQLGGTLAERDDLPAARTAFDEAVRRDPSLLRAAIARELVLPMLPDSRDALVTARARYEAGLARLEDELPARATGLTPERLQDELRWSNFLLAYQGEDDRALQSRYGALAARLLAARAPGWVAPRPMRTRAGRIRVGFVSTFFRDGTAGRYFERWVTDLPQRDFEVFAYHLLPGRDVVARRIAARADHFRHMPWWRPAQAAPVIRDDDLDILVYPELGMGAVPFALASLRLARVQCAGWGHPVTTGLPTIDAYLSCAGMEPDGAQGHYSERLVLLPGIGTRYAAPQVPSDGDRARFGLPTDAPLFLCSQSLFKIHPDNDAMLARVLEAAPRAQLVIFAGRDPSLTARMAARFARAGIATERLRVLAQCSHDDFLRINRLGDAMLDTLHWSGGNTSLDALAAGLPVVTLPGRFMRGRQSAAMLAAMGVPELVARDEDDYVRIAAGLVADRGRRDALAARIAGAPPAIFDPSAPVEAFAQRLRDLSDGA